MNQILYKKINKKYLKKLMFQLILSLFFITVLGIYGIHFILDLRKKENLSQDLLNSFNIQKLYSKENQNYIVVNLNENKQFFVVGVIEIPKINIRYPILSDVNDEYLKISACRFYGPYPNRIR